ncbi:FAD binding domain-containing protein [Exophiala viscosa]|uniref:FAD binding domain-containing protein n=1 Tax=Exophiala viscosa TaxID=2486360 RepID=A0AAN6IFZ3_9EURO|nr:FAD binding domain-containing protein [Exophiala viscosa]KAI1630341.1 FAD binding domain-containing protein [Exophiala viscosa]
MGSLSASQKRGINPEDINALQSLLSTTGGTLLTPHHEAYPASIKRWSRAAEKPAGAVLTPSTAEQVSIALKYASEQNIDVAVKGGGHSTAGVSSTNGGLLIDLNAKMRGVEVDIANNLFRVQGGCTWGDVDQAGTKHGLATVGGTVADTGVGGLLLGGGYGWLSGQHGLSIDCLVEATVVLATGEIVKASSQDDPELLWALQGAGQNFGVVTEFVLRAFDQGDAFAGLLIFPPMPELVDKVVAATNDLYTADSAGKTKVAGRGTGGIAIARPPPAGGQVMLLVSIIYFGTEQEAKQVFKPLYDLGPVLDTTAVVPYPTVNTILAPPIGLRASMKGAAFTVPMRPEFVKDVLAEYVKFTDGNDDTSNSVILFEMYDPAQVVARETGSFANRGWHLNGLVLPMWTKQENDKSCRQWARDVNEMFKKELEAHGKPTGKGVDGGVGVRGDKGAVLLYGNYDQYDEKSRDIFGENYPRLQALKARYDPTSVFDKLFAIAPQA